jgi:hypothetical protein
MKIENFIFDPLWPAKARFQNQLGKIADGGVSLFS